MTYHQICFRQAPWRRWAQLLHRQDIQPPMQQEEDVSLKTSQDLRILYFSVTLYCQVTMTVRSEGFQFPEMYSWHVHKRSLIFKAVKNCQNFSILSKTVSKLHVPINGWSLVICFLKYLKGHIWSHGHLLSCLQTLSGQLREGCQEQMLPKCRHRLN